jgi:hypothetical protein
MDDKAYYKEHSELINLLRSTANKLEHEADKQAAEVKKMKGGLKGGMDAPRGSLVSTAVATPVKVLSSGTPSAKVSTKSSPVPAQQSAQDINALISAAVAKLQAMQPPQQQGEGKGKKKCMLGIKGGCGLCGGC